MSESTAAAPTRRSRGIFYGWYIVAVSVLLMAVVFGTIINIFSVFVLPVGGDIGATQGQFSLAYSVITLAALPMSPIVGNLLKKVDARYVIAGGLVCAIVGNVLLSMAQNIAWVYIAAIFQGVGLVAATTIPVSAMMTNWFIAQRGLALGIATAGTGLGAVIFIPLVRSTLMPSIGWSNTYLAIGGIQAILIPLVLLILRSTPEQKGLRPYGWTSQAEVDAPSDSVRVGLSQPQVYRTASFWLMGIALIFSGISVNGMISILDPMLLAMYAPEDVVVLVLTTAGLFVILGKLGTGWLFDHVSLMLTIVIVAVANTAQFYFMLYPTNTFNGLMFAFLHGIGATMVTVTPAFLTAKLFGDRDYSAVFGSVSVFITTGMVVAAPFGLLFYDGVSGNPATLVWAWMGTGLAGLLFYILTVLLRPKWDSASRTPATDAATAHA